MYNLSKLLSIPLYVLIRNDLGISDEQMLAVISLPQKEDTTEVKTLIQKECMNDDTLVPALKN